MTAAAGNVNHRVGLCWGLLERAFRINPRTLCGATLILDAPHGYPLPDDPDCGQCLARSARTADRSWNAAIVASGLCFAAFLASVIATTSGWHSVTTGRTAAASAVAMVACGVWLRLSAARFGPLEPEPGEDALPCPYESCHHSHPETEGTATS